MSDIYKRVENDTYRLTIFNDNDSESPRDWCNVGTMVCFSRRHSIGDKHHFIDKDDFLDTLVSYVIPEEFDSAAEFISELTRSIDNEVYKGGSLVKVIDNKIIEFLESKGYAILPIFLYDHSGITISTGAFNCQWDSGQIGWIYANPQTICKEYGTYSPKNVEKAKNCMRAEVEVYDQYIRGDVYGFKLEKKVKCECCSNVAYEEEDSCWGFYGDDWKENGVLDHVGKEHEGLVNML